MTTHSAAGEHPPSPTAILLAGASPSDRDALAIDREFDEIEAAVRRGALSGSLRVILSHGTEADEMVAKMLDDRPSIVHFSGHGTEFEELIFETSDGTAIAVDVGEISRIFSAFSGIVRCVVLSACYSAAQAADIAAHVDCVIGMSDRFSDAASESFASAFYRSIANAADVATAFDLAVVNIELSGLTEAETPALFGRERAAMLSFDGRPASPTTLPIDADRESIGRELYEAHYLDLVRLASSVIDSVSVCEGVVQEAFVKFLRAGPDAESRGAGGGRLGELRRLVLDVAASRRERAGGSAPPAPADAPDEITAILRAVKTLAGAESKALVLDQLQQLSRATIATTLGLDESTLESTLSSAIDNVATLLGGSS